MKRYIQYLAVLGVVLLLPAGQILAAFNDVTTSDSAVSIVLPGNGLTYTIDARTKVESFTVNTNSIDFRLTTGSVVLLQSTDKSVFVTSGDSTCSSIVTTCGSSNSTITINCSNPNGDSSPHTLTVTPTGTCSTSNQGGGVAGSVPAVSGGSSGGGGGAPVTPTPVVAPNPVVNSAPIPTISQPEANQPVSTQPTQPKTSAVFLFTRNLTPASKGLSKDIIELQKKLQTLGFLSSKLKPNGVYGPATVTAVKNYQKSKGIVETNVGTKTRAALNQ